MKGREKKGGPLARSAETATAQSVRPFPDEAWHETPDTSRQITHRVLALDTEEIEIGLTSDISQVAAHEGLNRVGDRRKMRWWPT